jgi:phage terminase large subunit-like protein
MKKRAAIQVRPGDIVPNPGPQTHFLSTPADIAIFGGAAGGSKTYGLLLEAIRHVEDPHYGFVILRRKTTHIRMEGGLWDRSEEIFPLLRARPNQSALRWIFPSGATGKFWHLEHEKSKFDFDGAEIPMLGFDELQHFTRGQFFYLLSRIRSTRVNFRPYVRATCNPDADSWLADFIAWWIDPKTGYPIPERSGIIRWFFRFKDEFIWGNSVRELVQDYGINPIQPKSVTFIPAKLSDNPHMLENDPDYLTNLLAQSEVDRERLLEGNWKIRYVAGTFFRREWWKILDELPGPVVDAVRYWDLAATEGDDQDEKAKGSRTAGVHMVRCQVAFGSVYVIVHCKAFRASPGQVDNWVIKTAADDQEQWACAVAIERDPGQAGIAQAYHFIEKLEAYEVLVNAVHESKGARAKPCSAQVEHHRLVLLRGEWTDAFIDEASAFDGRGKYPCDRIDAMSGAYSLLLRRSGGLSGDIGKPLGGPALIGRPA